MSKDRLEEFKEVLSEKELGESYYKAAYEVYRHLRKPRTPGEMREILNNDGFLLSRKEGEYGDDEYTRGDVDRILTAGEASGIIEGTDGECVLTEYGQSLVGGIDRLDFII